MVFGLEIKKSGTFKSMETQIGEIQKELKEFQMLRPSMDYFNMGYGGHGSSHIGVTGYGTYAGYVPNYTIGQQNLEALAIQSDIFMTSITALRNKIFRRGFKITEIRKNPEQLARLKSILRKLNTNNQTLKDVLRLFEFDEDIYDDAYLISINDYIFGLNGEIVHTETKEIIRASPTVMSIISDPEGRPGYNIEGDKVFVSPKDRKHLIKENEAKSMNFMKDGVQLQPAHHRGTSFFNNSSVDIFYIEGEVLHQSKYNPSLIYGSSPLYSLWMKITTLIEQDRYLLLNYQKGRPPRGMLTIPITNYESTKKAWESLKAEARKDPHAINPFLYDNQNGGGKPEWIEFMKPLGDMQFIETRNEMRRAIGARMGVMPLFSGDISQSGGLNSEDLQITVTNQAVEEGQKLYNEKVLIWILKKFGITDYSLVLEEPEEKDEVIEAKLMGVKIDNALKMSQVGFDVSYDKESNQFRYSEEATTPADTGIFGGPSETKLEGIDKELIDLSDIKNKEDFSQKVREVMKFWKEDMIINKELEDSDIQKADDSLTDLLVKQLFDKTFEGLSKQKSNQINKLIMGGVVNKVSITEMIKKIEKLGVDKNQASMIVRTESNVLKNTAREFNWKQSPNFKDMKFRWIGPADSRTSDVSKELKKITKKGLPLEDLKNLVKKTAEDFGFKPTRDFETHPNMRHIFSRVF